jgi:hypothetical protein
MRERRGERYQRAADEEKGLPKFASVWLEEL